MGRLARWLGVERRAHPSEDADWARIFGSGLATPAGVDVSVEGSLQSAVVYACVRVLAESVAQLPLFVYRRRTIDGRTGKERAPEHPLYGILHDLANPEQTAFQLRETMMYHVLTWGNAFAEKELDGAGRLRALWPLRPDKMTVRRLDGALQYGYELPGGEKVTLPQSRVHHVAGLAFDGVLGYSPIRVQMNSIGMDLAVEEYGARWFGNGARPGGVLRHPGQLRGEAINRLRASWRELHEGLSNASRIAILEEGMEFQAVGVPPEESQFLETRKFQRSIIAGWYRVPPHMIGDLDRATFSNIEHQSIDFVVHSLGPWLVRIEKAIYRDLLTPAERREYYAEHLVGGLLRGDIKSRYDAYAVARQNGWLSTNDIRELENLNPVDGGDRYLEPLNMVAVGEGGEGDEDRAGRAGTREERARSRPEREQRNAATLNRLAETFLGIIEDSGGRVLRREIADLRRAVDKYLVRANDLAAFLIWLDEFYRAHETFMAAQFGPVFETIARAVHEAVGSQWDEDGDEVDRLWAQQREFAGEYTATLAQRLSISDHRQLTSLIAEAGAGAVAAILLERLDSWEQTSAAKLARRESHRSVNAFGRNSAVLVGRREFVWITQGSETCPYCQALNGHTVGVEETFMEPGDFSPDGAEGPLQVRHRVLHPPLHDGCNCVVVAR